jgi:hypothetical protein
VDEISVFFISLSVLLVVVAVVWWGAKKLGSKTRGYVRTEYGGQMELDMRLPYKRFKELYPYSKMTYQEYKQLQMKSAFRRAVSSDKNKRMVR